MGSFKRFVENLIPVPVVYQSHNYDCGAAALRAVCQFWGVGPDQEDKFIKACDTDPKFGTSPKDIIKVARILGLKAEGRERLSIDMLKQIIDSGKPVICAIQAWEYDPDDEGEEYEDNDAGHYVVAIGYDDHNIFFQDPSIQNNRRGHIPYDEFIQRWHDTERDGTVLTRYGIVIWKDDHRPEKVDPDMRSSKIK